MECAVTTFSVQGTRTVNPPALLLRLGTLNRAKVVGVGRALYLVLTVVSPAPRMLFTLQLDLLFRITIDRIVVTLKSVVTVKECPVKVKL